MDRNTDSLWRMERNIHVCSPHDASVELLWDSLPVFGGRIQEWAGSYEITGLGFDGFVAISWRIN